MAIQQFPLASSAIADIWYDSETKELWIQFAKKRAYPKYHLEGVPQDVVVGLLNDSSAGNYYHSRIKGRYQSQILRGPDDQKHIRLNQWKLLQGLE